MNEDDIRNFIAESGNAEPWKVKARDGSLIEAIEMVRRLCLGYELKECKNIVDFYNHTVKNGFVTVLALANGNKLHITKYQQGWKTELYRKPEVSIGDSEPDLYRIIQNYTESNVPYGPTA